MTAQPAQVIASPLGADEPSLQIPRQIPRRRRRRPGKLVVNLVVLGFALVWLIPVYWMLKSALQSDADLLSSPPDLLPWSPTLENFTGVLSSPVFWGALGASVAAAGLTVVVTVFAALAAALALARFGFRGKKWLIIAILVVQMIPAEALFISQYRMLDGWALLNSVAGLSLLYIGGVLPFVVWMLRGFVQGIPADLEEAAMVDGCSRMKAFFKVTFPLLAPGLISTSVFAFLHAWNEYTLALVVFTGDMQTLPLWLQSFQQGLQGSDWGGVMAGSVLIAVPVMVIFAIVQNRMSSGMVSGAVKG